MVFSPYPTDDGSFTFFSEEFGQTFHSKYGAREESIYKFAVPTLLAEKASRGHLKILDICYGLGYNTAAALETIWRANQDCHVELIALESDPRVVDGAIEHQLLNDWSSPIPEILTELARSPFEIKTDRLQARIIYGDARQTIRSIITGSFRADAVFLDPFSPLSCPQLWTVEFIELVAACCATDGRIATYSCAAAVRSAMIMAGLTIADTQPVGRKAPGTIATFDRDNLPPLSPRELEHLATRAGIPYRDPNLTDSMAQIILRREFEGDNSGRESTSQWKKRWQQKYSEP
jgi:tRNA U34 5-methylaminomethyl-2-thiouridine-forming methyltransferase MnmC